MFDDRCSKLGPELPARGRIAPRSLDRKTGQSVNNGTFFTGNAKRRRGTLETDLALWFAYAPAVALPIPTSTDFRYARPYR